MEPNSCHHHRLILSPGLSPAWMLHYVLVKDLQTGSSYYFLAEEWLSVDEKTDGRVEMEVEASGKAWLPCTFCWWVLPVGSPHGFLCSCRGGRPSAAAPPPPLRAAEGAVRESPVAVAVPETPPQPLHPPAESHLLHALAAAPGAGHHAVVQRGGGRAIQVFESRHLPPPFAVCTRPNHSCCFLVSQPTTCV